MYVPLMFRVMTDLDRRIHDALLAYLGRTGISGRRFGRDVLNDPGFVASLKRGRRLGLKTADAVLAAIGEMPIGPAFEREVKAFLHAHGGKAYVFGEMAAGDSRFVDRLEGGVSFRLGKVAKVRDWMARQADDKALGAMRRAVAGVPMLARAGDSGCQRKGENSMLEEEGRCLSVNEAAELLGISARSLYRMREDGWGPEHYRFGRRIVYRRNALERWAAEHLNRTPPDGGGSGRRAR